MLRHTSGGLPLRIRPVFEDFHRLTVRESYEYPLHKHFNYELIVVDQGPYRCTLNNQQVRLNHGEFLIIKPGDTHQDHLKKGQYHYVLHFRIIADARMESSNIQLFAPNVSPDRQRGIQALDDPFSFFRQLEMELGKGDVFSYYVQDSMLETFFWQLIRLLPRGTLSGQFDQLSSQMGFNAKLQALFEKNCRQNYCVRQMAKDFNLSERAFVYKFKEIMGQSPAKAFTAYRIQRATERLLSEEVPVQEIADEFGFKNPFHFSRAFKKVFGSSPRAYRRSRTP